MTPPVPTELPTEDLLGVEIVRAGGPYFGVAGPAGGTRITEADLDQAVASFAQLNGSHWFPVKLGHNAEQAAVRAESGGSLFADGEPAIGWLDNMRRDGKRLLVDLRRVPAKVAALVKAGAWRGRSVEIVRGYRDGDGNRHPFVVTALALLGANEPAVRGMDDIVDLYAAEQDTRTTIAATGTLLAAGGREALAVSDAWLPLADRDRPWDENQARVRVLAWAGVTDDGTDAAALPESALARLRTVHLVWTDGGGSALHDFSHLVADIVDGAPKAVPAAVFHAAGAIGADGSLAGGDLAAARARLGDWYRQMGATPPWGGLVAASDGSADDWFAAGAPASDHDMEDVMDPKEIRAALGLADDADDAAVLERAKALSGNDEKLTAAQAEVETLKETIAAGGQGGDGDQLSALQGTVAEQARQIEALTALAQEGAEARKEQFATRRDAVIEKAIRDRVLTPGQRAEWAEMFEANPEGTTKLIAGMTPRTDLSAETQGDDGAGGKARIADIPDDEFKAGMARLGLPTGKAA